MSLQHKQSLSVPARALKYSSTKCGLDVITSQGMEEKKKRGEK